MIKLTDLELSVLVLGSFSAIIYFYYHVTKMIKDEKIPKKEGTICQLIVMLISWFVPVILFGKFRTGDMMIHFTENQISTFLSGFFVLIIFIYIIVTAMMIDKKIPQRKGVLYQLIIVLLSFIIPSIIVLVLG